MNNEWESIDKVIFVISLGRSNTNIFGKDYWQLPESIRPSNDKMEKDDLH
jgi:hypothetical protein